MRGYCIEHEIDPVDAIFSLSIVHDFLQARFGPTPQVMDSYEGEDTLEIHLDFGDDD